MQPNWNKELVMFFLFFLLWLLRRLCHCADFVIALPATVSPYLVKTMLLITGLSGFACVALFALIYKIVNFKKTQTTAHTSASDSGIFNRKLLFHTVVLKAVEQLLTPIGLGVLYLNVIKNVPLTACLLLLSIILIFLVLLTSDKPLNLDFCQQCFFPSHCFLTSLLLLLLIP